MFVCNVAGVFGLDGELPTTCDANAELSIPCFGWTQGYLDTQIKRYEWQHQMTSNGGRECGGFNYQVEARLGSRMSWGWVTDRSSWSFRDPPGLPWRVATGYPIFGSRRFQGKVDSTDPNNVWRRDGWLLAKLPPMGDGQSVKVRISASGIISELYTGYLGPGVLPIGWSLGVVWPTRMTQGEFGGVLVGDCGSIVLPPDGGDPTNVQTLSAQSWSVSNQLITVHINEHGGGTAGADGYMALCLFPPYEAGQGFAQTCDITSIAFEGGLSWMGAADI